VLALARFRCFSPLYGYNAMNGYRRLNGVTRVDASTCSYGQAMVGADHDWRPKYVRIADDLAAQIKRGQLKPGQILPGEPYLMQLHDASRGTVRHAIGLLREQGLIVTYPGRGSFVVDNPPI
jgi:GntR family transcriptional regulator